MDVHYLPLFPAVVCPGLFIAPVFSTFFPLLPSDVPRLQKFLRSTVLKCLVLLNRLFLCYTHIGVNDPKGKLGFLPAGLLLAPLWSSVISLTSGLHRKGVITSCASKQTL